MDLLIVSIYYSRVIVLLYYLTILDVMSWPRGSHIAQNPMATFRLSIPAPSPFVQPCINSIVISLELGCLGQDRTADGIFHSPLEPKLAEVCNTEDDYNDLQSLILPF